MRTGKAVVGCLVLLIASIATAAGQEGDDDPGIGGGCGDIRDISCPSGYHSVEFTGWNNRPHGDCLVCNSGGSSCHTFCWGAAAPEITKLYLALQKGSANEILTLALRVPEYVTISRSRNSIQVASCDQSMVIANIHLPKSRSIDALVARLEDMQTRRLAVRGMLIDIASRQLQSLQ